jgi:enoyl-CoA hydratase
MNYSNLLVENRDRILYITINRASKLNALNKVTLAELHDIITSTSHDEQIGGIIITGAGQKAFVAGADITEFGTPKTTHEPTLRTVVQTMEAGNKPVIAAISGFCLGGGLELALSCTFRIATARAKMGLPEIKLGLIPGYGGTQRLPRLIGEGRALDIILSGRTVEATEAERIGLVTRLVDEGNPYRLGTEFLAPYLKHGLLALEMARQAISRGVQTTLEQGLKIERDLSTLIFQTADANEGMTAFVEKRPAAFKDK